MQIVEPIGAGVDPRGDLLALAADPGADFPTADVDSGVDSLAPPTPALEPMSPASGSSAAAPVPTSHVSSVVSDASSMALDPATPLATTDPPSPAPATLSGPRTRL